MNSAALVRAEDSAEYWAERVRPHLARTVEAILETGHELVVAKETLAHGEFERLGLLLHMSSRAMRMFMSIACCSTLSNRNHGSDLPASWRTLYELSRLDEDQLETAIHAGEITPDLERKMALQLVARYKANGEHGEENVSALPEPVLGTYLTITADPPWQYGNRATRAAAADHYPTLTAAEVSELEVDGRPVCEVAAPNAHLYLWTTNAFLREAFDVVEAWGFTYKTCLTWVKPQLGIGNYFRSSTEHILFGVRGELRVRDSNRPNWFEARRGNHSRKPDHFYELVEAVSPGPYLELFARSNDLLGSREGWTTWGNEA